MNSWNGSVRPRAPTQVVTGWSDIGSTRARTPSASVTRGLRLGEACARAQALGAHEARRKVAVAEPEPVRHPGGLERLHHLPGVVAQAPAALVDRVGEPVRHEVGVGRDVDAVDLDVVARVGDDGELAGDVEQAAGELGAARAAGQQQRQTRSSGQLSTNRSSASSPSAAE